MTNDAERRFEALRRSFFLFGAFLTLVMVGRAQMGGDQLNLLARGYLFAKHGIITPYGNPMSGGGKVPGTLTGILVGAPLKVWFDNRAPSLSLWVLQILGYFLLDHVLKSFLSARERMLFTIFYWLSPAHLYYSVLLWNPSYLLFLAAAHLWTIVGQRNEPSFVLSFFHCLTIGVAGQLHVSAFVLVVHSFLLWKFGYFKVSWCGLICGALVILLTLLPWVFAVLADPGILPGSHEGRFFGRGLLYVYPLYKGIYYALALPTFWVTSRIYRFDFRSLFGDMGDAILAPLMKGVGYTLGVVTFLLAIAAVYWFYRQYPLRQVNKDVARKSDREWLAGVVALGQMSAILSFALSPTGINGWQVIMLQFLSALPLVFFIEHLASDHSPIYERLRCYFPVLATCGICVVISVGIASPFYRKGGRGGMGIPLRNHHAMLDDLHLQRDFDLPVYDDGTGWWMDVLPDKYPPPGGEENWVGKPWGSPDWEKR